MTFSLQVVYEDFARNGTTTENTYNVGYALGTMACVPYVRITCINYVRTYYGGRTWTVDMIAEEIFSAFLQCCDTAASATILADQYSIFGNMPS